LNRLSLLPALLGVLFLISCKAEGEKVSSNQVLPQRDSGFTLDPADLVTADWLSGRVRSSHPRLLLTPERIAAIREEIRQEGLLHDYYTWIKWNADQFLKEKPLVYRVEGRRMLGISREALNRIACLALAANFESDHQRYIDKVNEEILAVASFSDWNPGHFLDVAEMALAVSLGLDWCHDMLPEETILAGKRALIDLALKPGIADEGHNFWIEKANNWNQVCHGGIIAAALTVSEAEPDLSARVIRQALEYIPIGLEVYKPDGLYPEGPGYWIYGTYYTVLTSEMLRTALGTDFGITRAPGFMESALAGRMLVSPAGLNFNFGDCSLRMGPLTYWSLLAWFDQQGGKESYFTPGPLKDALKGMLGGNKTSRWLQPIPFTWMVGMAGKEDQAVLPDLWVAHGKNPVAVFTDQDDPRGFYFGTKGGQADLSHGNMDAGSFVYELDGFRWFLDLGMQSYGPLEEIIGGGLWNPRQDSDRWTLLSKNNLGHSTLTVNGSLHQADGFASLDQSEENAVKIDLAQVLGSEVKEATRRITRVGDYTMRLEDRVVPNELTEVVTAGFMTTADVEVRDGVVFLREKEKTLQLVVLFPEEPRIEVVPLTPPPLDYDLTKPGLKRIDIYLAPTEKSNSPALELQVEMGP